MIFVKKIINTFLTPRWKHVYKNFNIDFVKKKKKFFILYFKQVLVYAS